MAGPLRALVIKELLAVWADKRSRMVLIVPPLIQLLVFSFAATQEVRNVHLGVLNQDLGKESRELVARFAASPTFTRIVPLRHVADMREAIESQAVLAALHVGPDFSRRLAAGHPASVQLVLDGRKSTAAQAVYGYARHILSGFAAERVPRSTGDDASSLVVRHWFNSNLDSLWFTVPGLLGILIMLVSLIVTALSVAREREMGTLDQLLVSPLGPGAILLGKALPALIIGVIEGTVILLAAVVVFGVPFTGSLALLYAAMTVYIAAVVGVGLFLSSLSATQQQAILGAFVFMVPAILLSGFAAPVENMPDWLQTLSLADPLRHFLRIIHGVFLKDMPAATVLEFAWPMAVIALVTLGASTWLFRSRF